MSRLFLTLALAFTLAASALAPTRLVPTSLVPIPVKADWQQASTRFLGFTAAGDLVTQRGNETSLGILDAATGQQKQTIVFPEVPNPREINLLAFTPDLTTLAWTNLRGDTVTVRTPQGEWTTPPASGVKYVRQLALSSDGKTLAVATQNGYVQLWNVATHTRQHTLMRATDPLAFSAHGQTIATRKVFEKGLGLWNVATGEKRIDLPQIEVPSRPLQFLPDGTLLAAGTRTALNLSRLEQGDYGFSTQAFAPYLEPCSYWKICRRDPQTGSASSDGKRFLMGIYRTPEHRAAGLLYDQSGKLLQVLDVGKGFAPLLTPDGQRLVWALDDGKLLEGPVPR